MGHSLHGSLLPLVYPRCAQCSAQNNASRGIYNPPLAFPTRSQLYQFVALSKEFVPPNEGFVTSLTRPTPSSRDVGPAWQSRAEISGPNHSRLVQGEHHQDGIQVGGRHSRQRDQNRQKIWRGPHVSSAELPSLDGDGAGMSPPIPVCQPGAARARAQGDRTGLRKQTR